MLDLKFWKFCFDKCIYSLNPHPYQDIEHYYHPRKIPWALSSQFNSILVLSFPQPPIPSNCCSGCFHRVLPFTEHHMNGIIEYVLLRLVFASSYFFTFFSDVAGISNLLPLYCWVVVQDKNIPQFNYSFIVNGHLDYLKFLAVTKNRMVQTFLYGPFFVNICFHFSWVKRVDLSKSKIAGVSSRVVPRLPALCERGWLHVLTNMWHCQSF